MLNVKIPYLFLKTVCPSVTWEDLEFGLKEHLIPVSAVIDHALTLLNSDNIDSDVMEIACTDPELPIIELVTRLANKNRSITDDDVKTKWLLWLLTWVYENRSSCEDPLALVEEIYADFDYPKEISFLVRYMPSDEPDLGSKLLNEARIIEKWHKYIIEKKREFC